MLTVGDGNFSFSAALRARLDAIEDAEGWAVHLTATSFDSHREVTTKYLESEGLLRRLAERDLGAVGTVVVGTVAAGPAGSSHRASRRRGGVAVCHGVDASDLGGSDGAPSMAPASAISTVSTVSTASAASTVTAASAAPAASSLASFASPATLFATSSPVSSPVSSLAPSSASSSVASSTAATAAAAPTHPSSQPSPQPPFALHGPFDLIIFNFPHTGVEDFRRHQALLAHFFDTAKTQLRPGGHGQIQVALANDQPRLWRVVDMAALAGLALIEDRPFRPEAEFPGYEVRSARGTVVVVEKGDDHGTEG